MEKNLKQVAGSHEIREKFISRHIGPRDQEIDQMLQVLNLKSLEELTQQTVPQQILTQYTSRVGDGISESQALAELKRVVSVNQVFKSYIGMGYSDCITPSVILRNILENPGWYTQYTPYQAEIAQGRLEALLNYQTMVSDLTGLPVSNASLLDEATAAAEAMSMAFAIHGRDQNSSFLVSENCHPQTLAVIQTRAKPLGIRVRVGDPLTFNFEEPIFAVLLQYPATDGKIFDYKDFIKRTHQNGALVIMAADLLSLTLITPPGELGADIAVGSSQRFGVALGYGGPHAAYFSTKDDYKRLIPGRIVGVSEDVNGNRALRLALQTREQHIRRDKATSNICTAQVLLAVMASMYAVYHGPEGLKQMAQRVHLLTCALRKGLKFLGYAVSEGVFFDTLKVNVGKDRIRDLRTKAYAHQMNLRWISSDSVGVSLDETTGEEDVLKILEVFNLAAHSLDQGRISMIWSETSVIEKSPFARQSVFLQHPVFNKYHSETEMLRYLHRLQSKDLSLTHSMIPLGSCTMKLNATSEMIPVTWPEISKIHPFAPSDQVQGYQVMLRQLEGFLAEITGFAGVSLQPNAGSQGEYAGLLAIQHYHHSRGDLNREVCLIPKSAHGTNPASAAMAGMKVVVVDCDSLGNIDLEDLRKKVDEHRRDLAALMVTYPSTHGVFEDSIQEVCSLVHQAGGQVYMDGANMNAQIGICRPGEFGPDVCHLNLHKTFCIPHGGGGPGMGPIAVAEHLVPFLPSHPILSEATQFGVGPVSAAPYGSASILPISWMYIRMMGAQGLRRATQVAILNANYVAYRLRPYYPVLYQGKAGFVAHECIFDLRGLKDSAGIEVEDVAKRLMDYGYHAPTISFPVSGTIMVEPTESESKEELDRFCDALISIRMEIHEIEEGKADRKNNLLKNAPHTAEQIAHDQWDRPYSRQRAVFPNQEVRDRKFWPSVGRINNVLGDRNLICSCPPIESYEDKNG